MLQTFANLPQSLNDAITQTITNQTNPEWLKRAEILHQRYMTRTKNENGNYISDYADTIAYLALRAPATYAQIYGALSQITELIPAFNPKSVLDIGSGPGTGIWAAKTVWTTINLATCIDKNEQLLITGEEITQKANIIKDVTWTKWDSIRDEALNVPMSDVVIVANVLNEMPINEARNLLGQAFNRCRGILIIVEPGTPFGIDIIQAAAKSFANKNLLLAPYIDNSFVTNKENWLHFSQRFIRPEFQRRIRQRLRIDPLAASDWEEAKYAYTAISKIPADINIWGRVIGLTQKQKGFIEIPILTKDGISNLKVMKRHKTNYNFAKDLKWGQIIKNKEDLIFI